MTINLSTFINRAFHRDNDKTMDDLHNIYSQVNKGKSAPSDKQIRVLLEHVVEKREVSKSKDKSRKSKMPLQSQMEYSIQDQNRSKGIDPKPLAMSALQELEKKFPGKLAPVARKYLLDLAPTKNNKFTAKPGFDNIPRELAEIVFKYEAKHSTLSEAGMKCLEIVSKYNPREPDLRTMETTKKYVDPFFLRGGSFQPRTALASLIRMLDSSNKNLSETARGALTSLHEKSKYDDDYNIGKALKQAAFDTRGGSSSSLTPKQALEKLLSRLHTDPKQSVYSDESLNYLQMQYARSISQNKPLD